MLIKIFGIWVMSTAILGLKPSSALFNQKEDCYVLLNSDANYSPAPTSIHTNKNCDEVAAEINKQLKDK